MGSNFEAPSLNSPPSGPPGRSMSSLGWNAKPDAGLGPEASNPQIQALQGLKMMEMGAQQLSAAIPELAGPIQQIVQQLAAVVPQLMSQQMAGTPVPSMTPAPAQVAPGA